MSMQYKSLGEEFHISHCLWLRNESFFKEQVKDSVFVKYAVGNRSIEDHLQEWPPGLQVKSKEYSCLWHPSCFLSPSLVYILWVLFLTNRAY